VRRGVPSTRVEAVHNRFLALRGAKNLRRVRTRRPFGPVGLQFRLEMPRTRVPRRASRGNRRASTTLPSRASSRRPETGATGARRAARPQKSCNNCRIRRSLPLSRILRTAVGPVRPVIPGVRRRLVFLPPEQHPRCDSGKQHRADLGGFQAGEGFLPRPRPSRSLSPATAASRGYARRPGTGFGAFWTSFVGPGPDGPSGSGLHIVFCGALKASHPVDHLEIPTKDVGKVPSSKSPMVFRMRFGRREIGPEDRFARHAYESAIQA